MFSKTTRMQNPGGSSRICLVRKRRNGLQCVMFQTNLPKILGGNHTFMAGSYEAIASRLLTSLLLPLWLAFGPKSQFHVSLGCYPQPSHQHGNLVHHGHSLWFCLPQEGCSWWLNPCSSPLIVIPRGPELHTISKEAGPQLMEDSTDGPSLPRPS